MKNITQSIYIEPDTEYCIKLVFRKKGQGCPISYDYVYYKDGVIDI